MPKLYGMRERRHQPVLHTLARFEGDPPAREYRAPMSSDHRVRGFGPIPRARAPLPVAVVVKRKWWAALRWRA